MSLTKELQQWGTVGRTSPEMALRQLDTFGVDWHITERGDLMIRYWQLGAEGFVSPERVAEIQENRRPPQASDALEWVSATLPTLRARYAGRWIAVVDGRVIADAASLAGLLQATQAEGALNPFVTQIPAEPIVWNTLYAQSLLSKLAGNRRGHRAICWALGRVRPRAEMRFPDACCPD